MTTIAAFAIIVLVILFGMAMLGAVSTSNRSRSAHRRRFASSQPGLNKTQFHAQWQRVEELMRMPGADSTKSAIFEADKLLDIALRQNGFRGETMGERLKSARDHVKNQSVYQGMWDAHKMRRV